MGYKKIINIFLTVFAALFFVSNFALALEVEYPTLSTGANITSNTPLPEYLKYVFDFGMFVGFFAVFLSFVFAGVLYLLSPAVPNAVGIAKDRVTGAITGLLILVTVYLIITTINPQLKFFGLNELDALPPPTNPEKQAGVYLYNQRDCNPPVPESPNTASIPDLGPLKNRVNAVDIVNRPNEYYIAILYESPNFWGKCQYINPNRQCIQVDPFASSASIYRYDPTPDNDEGKITFYRKSFYNSEGGWRVVSNDEIKSTLDRGKFYNVNLSEFKFTDNSAVSRDNPDGCTVPEKERDCVQWDNQGVCIKRQCPSLAGENISSIEIKGNYVVMLLYFDESDAQGGPWSFCQEFSTKADINKDGPEQIKWENVRNISTGMLPNWMIIFPVEQK